MSEKVSNLEVHRRVRQQEVVDLLDELRKRSDDGKIVGCCVMFIDDGGRWHHDHSLFDSDQPAFIGYLQLMLHNFCRKYLTNCDTSPE